MSKQRSQAATDSGQVMTVQGPIAVEAMGVALMHEHLLVDARSWWHEPTAAKATLPGGRTGSGQSNSR